MCLSSPQVSAVPPPPAPLKDVTQEIQAAEASQAQKQSILGGLNQTMITGGQGAPQPITAVKSLLGS